MGYRVTTSMNIGVGASYLVGIATQSGSDKPNIHRLSSNGFNLRSYFDGKVRGNLFLQTNYEVSYRNSFSETNLFRAQNLSEYSRQSFMLGIKMKTPSTKRSQKTVEILYDFLHKQTGQPALVVRMGMEFLPKHAHKN